MENAHIYHAGEYKCTAFSQRSHTVYVLSGKVPWQSLLYTALAATLYQTLTLILPGQTPSSQTGLFYPHVNAVLYIPELCVVVLFWGVVAFFLLS